MAKTVLDRVRVRLVTGREEARFKRLMRAHHYGVTSRDSSRASPDEILAFSRGHWGIETRVHYMRDANYHEDRCRIRDTTAAHVCATLRTLAGWLLGRKADGHRRNTRRRQHTRLARHAGQALRLILKPDP